ncbi:hypothetical protein D3C87_532400 [compost metagenome]
MRKATLILIFIFIGIFVLTKINFPLKKEKIVGKYINMNFENKSCCVEAPHKADTLILYSDGSYESNFYGNGKYNFKDNILEIDYDYENGKAQYRAIISNKLFQKLRIELNYKLNHYYEKIE